MPGAGKLDRYVVIERRSADSRNEFNEDEPGTWSPFLKAWAQKRDASDFSRTEFVAADQVGSFLLSRFIIRSSPKARTITPSDRLQYKGAWNIKTVKETSEGRDMFIEITAVQDSD